MVVYHKLDPFGQQREDLRAGMIASPLLNIQLSKTSARSRPSEWILSFDPPEMQDPAVGKAILKALASSKKPMVKHDKRRRTQRRTKR